MTPFALAFVAKSWGIIFVASLAGILALAAIGVVILVVVLVRRKGRQPKPAVQARRCPECATPLPPDAPLGLCPKCVLKVGVDTQRPTQTSPSAPAGGSAAPFTPPTPAELAARFPQLEILELLGQGGMGAVYKARQPGLDRTVALKILPPGLGADPTFAERFTREARSLARLSHPNIVGVHDFGQAGDLYYFIMEYVDGVSLRQLEHSQRLEPAQALAIVPQVCEALQFAHDEGIVHRDIKPENILIDKKGRVKIADFGLAKLLGRMPTDFTLTQPQHVLGTPHYMAPEQMEKPATVDQRADIYSLGVVFYEMLTGELPLGRFRPPSQRVQMDVRLDEVVLKALEKEPERRYQQASQVKTDVEVISGVRQAPAGVGGPQAAGAAPAPSAQKPRSAVAIVAIVLAIVAGLVLTRSKRYPLSYDAVQRTFLQAFLHLKPTREPIAETEPFRRVERENLVRLMNLFVAEVLDNGRFDLNLGTFRMEERLANSPETVPDSHLRAYRICRRSPMIIWTKELVQAIALLLGTRTRYTRGSWSKDRPLWVQVLQEDWDRIRKMIRVVRDHKIWAERTNPEVVSAIALTRQKDWEQILLKGKLPGRQEQFMPALDQNFIFKASQEVS